MLPQRSRAVDAIMIDEVGIEYGVFGDVRLKSEYRLIFGQHAGVLVPVAASAALAAQKSGRRVPADLFRQCLMLEDQKLLGMIGRRIHLRNAANIGESALDMHIGFDLDSADDVAAAPAEVSALAEEAARFDIQPRRVVMEPLGMAAEDPDTAAAFAKCLRDHGMRCSVSLSAISRMEVDGLSLIRPEIVRVDRAWFHAIGRYLTATKLLSPLAESLAVRGAETVVEGVDSAAYLRSALEAGFDCMQGDLLSQPGLAGTEFQLDPKTLDSVLADDGARKLPG